MKRNELVRLLTDHGCRLLRHGANHDIFLNESNGRKAPVPRHSEIKDSLVRLILRQLGVAAP
jgi:mRNA interferase HicA